MKTYGWLDRNDPPVTKVVKRIIVLARQGERDRVILRAAVLKSFREDRAFLIYKATSLVGLVFGLHPHRTADTARCSDEVIR